MVLICDSNGVDWEFENRKNRICRGTHGDFMVSQIQGKGKYEGFRGYNAGSWDLFLIAALKHAKHQSLDVTEIENWQQILHDEFGVDIEEGESLDQRCEEILFRINNLDIITKKRGIIEKPAITVPKKLYSFADNKNLLWICEDEQGEYDINLRFENSEKPYLSGRFTPKLIYSEKEIGFVVKGVFHFCRLSGLLGTRYLPFLMHQTEKQKTL